MIVVKVFPATAEEGFVSELNEEALQRAKAYLATKAEHLQTKMETLNLSLTYSVEYERDVASTLVNVAEHEGKKEMENVGACSMIAISTHGRNGLQRLFMGSVTDRVLNTTKLPMLIVRPHNIPAHQGKEKQKKGPLQKELAGSSWVGLL